MIKKIAGRIMPALATTTSLISSLTTIELYKLLQNKDITQYKNSYVNLALSYFGYTEPVPAPIIETENNKFTLWDLERLPDILLKEVILYYERKYNIQIDEILIGSARIYSNIIKSKKQKERLDQNISIINKEFNQDGQIILYISGNDIEYPPCMILL
jgi:ubiquitin-activating enzyme E1